MKDKEKPIQIEVGEWYYKGCFIQDQSSSPHDLPKYHVFQDTDEQMTVGTCWTFTEAKRLCVINEVKNPVSGWKEELNIQ